MLFDIYAFADYSGATNIAGQHKAIAWSVYNRPQQLSLLRSGWTRKSLSDAVFEMLQTATKAKKRVIFGFDHCYSFPDGFYQAVHGTRWWNWRELLDWFHDDLQRVSANEGEVEPRNWAHEMNQLFITRDRLECGPFWGPNFTPLKRKFTYEVAVPQAPDVLWHERRLVEMRIKALKNIYQLGGAGSVGLQSLFGIYYIYELLGACEVQKIPVHVWPYDGWEIPAEAHVLVEVYATLYLAKSSEKRTDQGDALACTDWTVAQDEAGTLGAYFQKQRLALTDEEEKRVRLEGWVLGV